MSLIFDRKAYGYNELSRAILFDAAEEDTVIHFALPRVILEEATGKDLTSDNAMWRAFHDAQTEVEAAAETYWHAISDQHRRDGTAPPLGTPLVLVSIGPAQ